MNPEISRRIRVLRLADDVVGEPRYAPDTAHAWDVDAAVEFVGDLLDLHEASTLHAYERRRYDRLAAKYRDITGVDFEDVAAEV